MYRVKYNTQKIHALRVLYLDSIHLKSLTMSKLTVTNHNRNLTGLTYVYPVLSRRAGGLSIGINFNTNNACNWRCIYCQVPELKNGDFVLWESLAIASYLVDKEGSDLGGANAEERALVWQWTLWALIHLAQPLEKVVRDSRAIVAIEKLCPLRPSRDSRTQVPVGIFLRCG